MSDEVWDEERWEAFLKENDERIDRYRSMLRGFLGANPLPDPADTEQRRIWKEHLSRYLRARGIYPEEELLSFLFPDESDPYTDDLQAWLAQAGVLDHEEQDGLSQAESCRNLGLYQRAAAFAGRVLDWATSLPGKEKSSSLVQFCSCVSQIPIEVARGHGIGYEKEMIGGNIACVKRGLASANGGLLVIQEIRHEGYMDPETYRQLFDELQELRNDLGMYILELRDRFHLGLD